MSCYAQGTLRGELSSSNIDKKMATGRKQASIKPREKLLSIAEYEKRKLIVFARLNYIQLFTGIALFLAASLRNSPLVAASLLLAVLPIVANGLTILLLRWKQQYWSFIVYFGLYPILTCAVYLNRIVVGEELSLVLCAILSVFFLADKWLMLFSVAFSMISYFVLFLLRDHVGYPPVPIDGAVYMLSEIVMFGYVFFALYLLRKQSLHFEHLILNNNAGLLEKCQQIALQDKQIREKTAQLKKQASLLRKSNRLKTQLFSLVSHDLKDPLYALRNYFQVAMRKDISEFEMNAMIPEVIRELNHSAILVENLLEWAKCQLKSCHVNPEQIDMNVLMTEMLLSFELQSKMKGLTMVVRAEGNMVLADEYMIRLVMRNLISNAIKFSNAEGEVTIGTRRVADGVNVYVRDTGRGLDIAQIKRIQSNSFHSTPGTNNESGTGLGLMLCKEFLTLNRSKLRVVTEKEKGAEFSFTLPSGLPARNASLEKRRSQFVKL
jgi:two-component system sensor histidine kinase/response regulator